MKQTQNTHVVSRGRRGVGVLAGERKGSGSHLGEWRGSGVLSGAREKATAVTCTWTAPGQRENTGTVAKQKQLPSAGLVCAGRAPRRSREYKLLIAERISARL